MERALILETTFLVDFERERSRKAGAAHRLLSRFADHSLYITDIIAGELAAGKSMADKGSWERFIAPFGILETNRMVAWRYGTTYRYLAQNRLLIGSNDLWIAATGLTYECPVVTRNADHFRRVPNLTVIDY